jgi:hypothetical protein
MDHVMPTLDEKELDVHTKDEHRSDERTQPRPVEATPPRHERPWRRLRHHADDPLVGRHLLSPSGAIWTVRSLPRDGTRVVLISATGDGHGAVVDRAALDRMMPFEPLLRR